MDILRAPIYEDVPNGFEYTDPKGQRHLVGVYAQIIKYFAKYHNYDLDLQRMKNYKLSWVQKSIENGVFNLSSHSCTYRNVFANITFTYPVEWAKFCIMVPAEEELPRYWYVVWPFGPYIWTMLHLSVIWVAWFMRFLKHPTGSYCDNLLKSLAVILYSSNMNLKGNNLTLRIQLFYCILFSMGFILSSYYNSYLTVYNLRPVFQPYLKSVDDLLRAKIKVLVPSLILEELNNSPYIDLTSLLSTLVETSQLEVTRNMKNFRRSFAYMVSLNEWKFVTRLQNNLIQPVYQLSDVCFGDTLNTFPLRMDANFIHHLDRFILLVHQSGLYKQWQEQAFLAALSAKYYYLLKDEYPVDPLNLYYYRIAWIVLFTGSIFSCISFLIELKFYQWQKKRKACNRKKRTRK